MVSGRKTRQSEKKNVREIAYQNEQNNPNFYKDLLFNDYY